MFLKSCEEIMTWQETDLLTPVADAGVWRERQRCHGGVTGLQGSAVLA